MRILLCNNFVRGGSGIDEVVRQEMAVLQGAGHEVVLMDFSNRMWDEADWFGKIRLASATLYSCRAKRQVRELLKIHQFDVIHVHNVVPFMTDSIFDAMSAFNGIVVQHLHNYRFFCPSSYAFRSGRPCRSCRWCWDLSCVWFRCYRKSYAASLGLVASRWISAGRRVLWRREPDVYLAVSEAIKEAYVREGLPAGKVMVMPNPARDLSCDETRGTGRKRKLVFVGALLEAKGVLLLPALAKLLPGYQIHIIGAGEDENRLREAVRLAGGGNVNIHGVAEGRELCGLWSDAFLTLVPSLWAEPFGLVAVESFSMGIPVVTTGQGALSGLVVDGETGLVDSFAELPQVAGRIEVLWNDERRYLAISARVRSVYKENYSPERFGQRLVELIETFKGRCLCA